MKYSQAISHVSMKLISDVSETICLHYQAFSSCERFKSYITKNLALDEYLLRSFPFRSANPTAVQYYLAVTVFTLSGTDFGVQWVHGVFTII
jgi:hypothetical protein